ncbi:MAG: tRNA 2-thiouridine(34) synthase MnmA [Chlorobi bacterium]|nr:tRNA 2-thiouridine(34) synthase MnmA [Chlorobiota bacterium]
MSKKGRVLVAMSGGVDSSVAAYLLLEEGYDVIGITMKTWDYRIAGTTRKSTGCCTVDDIHDARAIALKLGFPHYVIDIREEFKHFVIDYFVKEYVQGRTPNPCISCNTFIKWYVLFKYADKLDCEYVATGHHARIRKEGGRWILYRGKDRDKDQSYVLWNLKQEELARTIFPVGNYYKREVRKIAKEAGLDYVADKPDSYEICFIPDNDYRGFLKRQVPELEKLEGGLIITTKGKVVGRHKGYPFYTIGQRRGLGIALGEPYYVVHIDPKSNIIVVGTKDELYSKGMTIDNTNWIKYEKPEEGMEVLAQIRSMHRGNKAIIEKVDDNSAEIKFIEPAMAVTPGQSAVLYEGDDVVGGGIIATAEPVKNIKVSDEEVSAN